ncbi:MAG TPA: penicillin-binding protein 2 [Chthoniobacterales bacterium]|jgi:cell division protein FtsI/penicillin-binding protein 2
MKSCQTRALIVCIGFVAIFSGYSARLIYLQVNQHDDYAALAHAKHIVKKPVYAQRGRIVDANHEVLADNTSVQTVYADASHILNSNPSKSEKSQARAAEIAALVAEHLDLSVEEVTAKIQTNRRFIVLKKEVDQLAAHALQSELNKRGLRGIYFIEDFKRVYPNGDMLCHVLGYLDHEHRGLSGIEKSMDTYLQQHDGYRFTERDRTGREILLYRGQERPAQDGFTVQTTINLGIQAIVESELKAACEKYKPKGATIIVMKPQTGAIMAMASWPMFDNNDANNAPPEVTKNHAILDMVEPGSTFKIVATAAAFEEGIVNDHTRIYCEAGRFHYGGRVLRDHHPYGDMTVHDILMKSSNVGVAKLALQLGEQRFYDYVRRFGFGDRTGIDLPGEISGQVNPPFNGDKVAITRVPMGHAVCVTPIQLTSAMAAIANGGMLMMPQVVSKITAKDGHVVSKFEPVAVRRVVSEATTKRIVASLADVVTKKGTAELAGVEGFRVAGKTGTAQKVNPTGGGYLAGKYIVSFCGFMPAEDPAFVAYVLLDDANTVPNGNYGGLVAAPIFSKVAQRVARLLDLHPDPALLAAAKDDLKKVSNTRGVRER